MLAFAVVVALELGLGSLDGLVAAPREQVHEVESGQTLWGIAKRYGVPVDAIEARNDVTATALRAGQRLIIPAKGWQRGDPKPGESAPQGAATKPASWTQVQKSPAERGGVNPCNTPDPGFGNYTRWNRGITMGQWIAPERGGLTRGGEFDVMIHFHGHEAARKSWVQVMDGAVLVGIDLGNGSGPYFDAFGSPTTFEQLIKSLEKAVAAHANRSSARVRHVGVSGWSAGYGAIQQIINQPLGKRLVDTVVLLDGLHCGYRGQSLNGPQIAPFLDWARRAARGEVTMFVSHSSIIPPGYASTTETAALLIEEVGGRPVASRPRSGETMGLDLIRRYSKGRFHVRGYAGNGPLDHCAHLGLYRDVLKVHVKPRWSSPRGYRSDKQS